MKMKLSSSVLPRSVYSIKKSIFRISTPIYIEFDIKNRISDVHLIHIHKKANFSVPWTLNTVCKMNSRMKFIIKTFF